MSEIGTESLTKRLQSLVPEAKALSSITALEVRSAVRRRERSGDLSFQDAAIALSALSYELYRVAIHPLTPELLRRATNLIDDHRLKALDSLQLASALEIANVPGSEVIFVSSDKFLLEAAKAEALEIWNPEDNGT